MKEVYKENRKIIILVLLIVLVAVWSGWGFMFPKEKVKEIYSSPEDFVQQYSGESYIIEIVSQWDDLFLITRNTGGPETLFILQRKNKDHWEVITQNKDYTVEGYLSFFPEGGSVAVWLYQFSESGERMILIRTITTIEPVLQVKTISDSMHTEFQTYEQIYSLEKAKVKEKHYSARFTEFNEKGYILFISGKAYPYMQWNEMFEE